MQRDVRLVVIGTGRAGGTVAHRCRAEGWSVAVVDRLPFGGTCALRGCEPKKVLASAAELVARVARAGEAGVRSEQLRIDWPALMRFKRSFTDPVPPSTEGAYQRDGIATFHGRARFVGDRQVKVDDHRLVADHVVVASGARPATLGIPGEEHLATSDDFLELEELPRRVLFVGGGYVAVELAHVAARAGAAVTIVQRGERLLERFEPELVDALAGASRQAGIELRLGLPATAVERRGEAVAVRVGDGPTAQWLEADLAVHAAGRVPWIDDMALAEAGIERDEHGVRVNEFMQSVSNRAVYAAGDCASSPGRPLSPVATLEAESVAANLLMGNHRKPDYAGVATVVFSDPPLASVGLREQEAAARGLRFRVRQGDSRSWYTSRRLHEPASAYKVIVERDSERILGAHLLGAHSEEVINLFALAVRFGLTAPQLAGTPFAFPTKSYDVRAMLAG